jgi:hypothetical protein
MATAAANPLRCAWKEGLRAERMPDKMPNYARPAGRVCRLLIMFQKAFYAKHPDCGYRHGNCIHCGV